MAPEAGGGPRAPEGGHGRRGSPPPGMRKPKSALKCKLTVVERLSRNSFFNPATSLLTNPKNVVWQRASREELSQWSINHLFIWGC